MAHPGAELYGSDRVFLESVSGLVDDGWRVVVTVPVDGPLVTALEERGAEVVQCASPIIRKSALRPRGMLRFIGASARGFVAGSRLMARVRPDAVYVNTMTIPLWQVLARLRRIPVLSHVHEGEASASRLVRSVLALPLFLSTAIVANSRFSAEVITDSFPSLGTRMQVVYNGVQGPPQPVASRPRLDTDLRVTYIGRLSPRKGVDVAIDALALLAERGVGTRLDVVGAVFPGYEWYESELRQQVTDKQLAGQVRFHGFQSSVWELVNAGDVVVVPSIADEPFGDTAVEAVLSGRRVIASATSGLLEATAGYATARTVAPGDAGALADALEETIEGWGLSDDAMRTDVEMANARHGPDIYMRRIAQIVASISRPYR
jgi:glycosyltransferase involved in cell wall biosynthesis